VNRPGTAREALIAEAIGDLAHLLDRAEALQPALLESSRALVEARAQLADQLAAFEAHVADLAEKAKVQAVKHILARTDEAARRSMDAQTRAMAEAAQTLFKAEIGPALQRLAMPLQHLVQRVDRPWEQWLTHAATAAVASAVTWALAAYVLAR
jgi:hypothetical protein